MKYFALVFCRVWTAAISMGSRAGFKGPKGRDDGWKLFTGDDVCFPVEVFLHTMELKTQREAPTIQPRYVINEIETFERQKSN